MRLVIVILMGVGFLLAFSRPPEAPHQTGASRSGWADLRRQIPVRSVENLDGAWIVGTKVLRHSHPAWRVAYSFRGDYVVSVSQEGEFRLSPLEPNGASPIRIEVIERSLNSMPKLQGACFANRDREIIVWGDKGVWRIPFRRGDDPREKPTPDLQRLFDFPTDTLVASNDGPVLVACTLLGHLRMWKPDDPSWGFSGRLWPGGNYFQGAIALSPDGRLVAALEGNEALVYTSTKHLVARYDLGKSVPVALRFSETGKHLFALTEDVRVVCFDLAKPEALWSSPVLVSDPKEAARTFIYSPSLRLWVIATGRGKVILWDADARRVRKEIQAASTAVFNLDLSPSGKELAFVSGGSESVGLLDLVTGEDLGPAGHRASAKVMGVADGRTVRSVGTDGRVVSFDRESLTARPAGVLDLALAFGSAMTPDGRAVAYGDRDGEISVVALPGLERRAVIPWPERKIQAMALSPGAESVAAYSTRGEIFVWDLATRQVLARSGGRPFFVWMGFRPGHQEFLNVYRQEVFLADLRSGQVTQRYRQAVGQICRCVPTPDGRSLAVVVLDYRTANLHLIDLDTGRITRSVKLPDLEKLPEGMLIREAYQAAALTFFDSGERCVVLRRTPIVVDLATGVATQREPLPLPPGVEPLFGVVAGPDLIVACSDTTLLVYPLRLLR